MSDPAHLDTLRVSLAQCEEALRLGIRDLVDREFIEGEAVGLKEKIRLAEWEETQSMIRAHDGKQTT